jgi:hypothetical protein
MRHSPGAKPKTNTTNSTPKPYFPLHRQGTFSAELLPNDADPLPPDTRGLLRLPRAGSAATSGIRLDPFMMTLLLLRGLPSAKPCCLRCAMCMLLCGATAVWFTGATSGRVSLPSEYGLRAERRRSMIFHHTIKYGKKQNTAKKKREHADNTNTRRLPTPTRNRTVSIPSPFQLSTTLPAKRARNTPSLDLQRRTARNPKHKRQAGTGNA